MIWTSHPGPLLRRTPKQARATYKSREGYTLRWVGSTHGVWTVEFEGTRLAAVSLLEDAKRVAEADHASR